MNDHPPPHVHVEKGDGQARFTIDPTEETDSKKFKAKGLKQIKGIIENNKDKLKKGWDDTFGN